jgi:single-strand DNA-binding protein
MSGVNRVTILGRLGKDPEFKTFNNGGSVANFSVATSETWKDKTTGEKKESTEWHNIVAYNPLSEIVQKYVRKGDQIYIEGKLKTRSWEKDGSTRYITEIVASSVVMIGAKKDGSSEQSAPSGGAKEQSTPASSFMPDTTDDLPF